MCIIAVSTYCFFTEKTLKQSVQFIADEGFKGIELWCNVYDAWPREFLEEDKKHIREIVRERELSLSLHAPSIGNNLASHNSGQREEAIKQLEETISLAAELKGKIVVVHPGTTSFSHFFRQHPGELFSYQKMKREAVLLLKDSLTRCAQYALENRVTLCLENIGFLNDDVLPSFEELGEVISAVDSPALKATLDLSHAHIAGDIVTAVNVLSPYIKHIHISDNFGSQSSHYEMGKGNMDIEPIAGYLSGFTGMMVMEIIEDGDREGAILRSRDYLEGKLAVG